MRYENVSALPTLRNQNRIGKNIGEFLPDRRLQPTGIKDDPGLEDSAQPFPTRTFAYDRDGDGAPDAFVTFELNRDGQPDLNPSRVVLRESNQFVTLSARADTGRINEQKIRSGLWVETVIDKNDDGKADILVQRKVGGDAVQYDVVP